MPNEQKFMDTRPSHLYICAYWMSHSGWSSDVAAILIFTLFERFWENFGVWLRGFHLHQVGSGGYLGCNQHRCSMHGWGKEQDTWVLWLQPCQTMLIADTLYTGAFSWRNMFGLDPLVAVKWGRNTVQQRTKTVYTTPSGKVLAYMGVMVGFSQTFAYIVYM